MCGIERETTKEKDFNEQIFWPFRHGVSQVKLLPRLFLQCAWVSLYNFSVITCLLCLNFVDLGQGFNSSIELLGDHTETDFTETTVSCDEKTFLKKGEGLGKDILWIVHTG